MAPFGCAENALFHQKFTKRFKRQEYNMFSEMAKNFKLNKVSTLPPPPPPFCQLIPQIDFFAFFFFFNLNKFTKIF